MYRNPKNLKVEFTTSYNEYSEPVSLILRREDIVRATEFSEKANEFFQTPSKKEKKSSEKSKK